MATKVVFVTSTGAVTVPSDFGTLVSVEVIGAGAGGKPASSGAGGEGGGGGAYSSSTAVTGITASGTVYVSTGTGGASGVAGGDTWFNAASNAAPTLTTQGALAKGGAIGASGTGGLGGAAASGVGTTKFSGGNGGASVSGAFGGGGGAAGPSGAGGAGGAGNSVNGGGGGGGGSNGGSAGAAGSTTGGDGGNGVGGTGGGLKGNNANGTAGTAGTGGGGGGAYGSTFVGGNGATGSVWTQTSNSATAGPGGGGGGTWYFGTTGGAGGLYGGGGGGAVTGGAGSGGIVVFTYNTTPPATRLTNNGTLFVNGTFDENTSISPAKFRTTANTVYAGTFDEFTGAPVADTSLMLWLDAGQSTSYSGSGATWTDLSPTPKNYTLTASPTFNSSTGGGVITFAGASSQYATSASTLFNSTTFNTYTMNLWVYPTGAGQLISVTGQATINTGYHYSAMEISAAGVIKFGQWTGTDSVIATSTQSLNTWYNLVITYNGTTATAYVNGVSVGTSNIAWSSPGANTFFALMAIDSANMGTSGYASGSIGAFMAYNRALTVNEVVQNYNALCNRYGLAAITTTQMPVVSRQTSAGTWLLNGGIFDENTGAV